MVSDHAHLPYLRAGVEVNTDFLCHILSDNGVDVSVVSRLHRDGSWRGLYNAIAARFSVSQSIKDNLCGYPVYRARSPFALFCAMLDREKPDLVVLQSVNYDTFAAPLIARNIPFVIYLHVNQFSVSEETSRNSVLVANSNFTAAKIRAVTGREPTVIRPIFEKPRGQKTLSPEYVLFVNTHYTKGLDCALTLAEKNPDIPFCFVRSWTKQPDYDRLFQDRVSNVKNISWIERVTDMNELYRKTCILLIPTGTPCLGKPIHVEETWGRVASEAQFFGVPVLATKNGGLPESVGPGGVLVEANASFDDWNAALRQLWHDKDFYDQKSAAALQHSAREDIQLEAVGKQFLSLCKATIDGAHGTPHG
jgi:glycosyltransferase involved in cell wall biosynthesis